MASHDWVAAKVLLQLGADPKALSTLKEDAVTFYCHDIARMKPTRQVQGVVYDVGVLLKIPELRPIAWPTWNASAEDEVAKKMSGIKRSAAVPMAGRGRVGAQFLVACTRFHPGCLALLQRCQDHRLRRLAARQRLRVKAALAAGQDPNAVGLQGIRPGFTSSIAVPIWRR